MKTTRPFYTRIHRRGRGAGWGVGSPGTIALAVSMALSAAWSGFAATPEAHVSVRLDAFKRIPILEGGRKMPMDSYARQKLLQCSGRSRLVLDAGDGERPVKLPAAAWLARVMFTPKVTFDEKIFLVNHPEVVQALGLAANTRDRYSFDELQKSFQHLEHLARSAFAIEEEERSLVERELIALHTNVSQYLMWMRSLQFARPNRDFAIADADAKKALGLPLDQTAFSFLDMFRREEVLRNRVERIQEKEEGAWTEAERVLAGLSRNLSVHARRFRSMDFHLIPVKGHGDEVWVAPWGVLSMGLRDPELMGLIDDFEGLVLTYSAGDQAGFDAAAGRIRSAVETRLAADRELKHTDLEIAFNAINPFFWSKVGYFLSFLLAFAVLLTGREARAFSSKACTCLIVLTLLPHTAGMIMRILITGRPPVTNLYTTFIFVGWVCVLLGVLVQVFQRNTLGNLMAGVSGLILMLVSGRFAAEGDTMHKVVAVLDSNFWLGTHVLAITTGYAGCLLAGVVGHVYLLQAVFAPSRRDQRAATCRILYGVLGFGLIFSFLGTMLGGVWADQSWGRFWGWDPKENGALLIVLWCAILFHARLGGMINDIGLAAGSALGMIVVMMAWLGVNLLSVGLHSYGFTSDLATALQTYIILQLLVIGVLSPMAYVRNRA